MHTFPKATTNAPQKCNQGIKPILANLLCQPIINVASQRISMFTGAGPNFLHIILSYIYIFHLKGRKKEMQSRGRRVLRTDS
jgi:hypothetical protein